ncbi:M56 family metallopeptidase [uncultured Winogradskyella sp.]|uniref:M56 family metallopeptidase n=1 Tax=uncultured Winogradskyella sp. TaxID=395353 RepID=UPI0030EDBC52|tara:strand:- start:314 stop:2611 length:2298 start_codon:yes stop_codon:yes gene_type:complete
MEYLLKASVVIAIFYLCFHLLLKKETFFNQNRWFLLIGIIIALIFPFLVIPVQITIEPIIATDNTFVITDNSFSTLPVSTPEASFEWQSLLPIIYSIGFLIFTIQFLLQFGSLIWLLLKNPKNKDGIYTYVIVNNKISPFSFFKWIVYNPESFTQSELDLMMTHEKVHASQLHSIDILLIQLACSIFWFNPFIWFYRREVRQNLEYIADSKTQASINNQKEYQRLLLKTSVANHNISFSNNFYNSSIKKRILMLKQSKSDKQRQWKYFLILPLLAGLLMSMNTETIYVETNETDAILKSKIITEEDENLKHIELINNSNTIELVVTKNTTNRELSSMTSAIEEKGGTLVFSQIQRNANNEITNLFLKLNNHSYGGGNLKNGIDAFIIYKEFFDLGGGFVGRINGATLHFDDKDNIHNKKATSALKKRAYKAIIKSGIQTIDVLQPQKKLKETPSTKQENIKITFSKEITNKQLDAIRKELQSNGIEMTINKIKRNNDGLVSILNIDFKTKNGSTNYSIKDTKGIKPFYFEMKTDGSFGVATIEQEKNITNSESSNNTITKDSIYTDANSNTSAKTNKNNRNSVKYSSDNIQPLIIVDDKEISKEDLKNIKANQIEGLIVLKDEKAIKKYGKKGKHGIIEITLKDEKDLDDNISTKNNNEKSESAEMTNISFTSNEDSNKNGYIAYISMDTTDDVLENHKTNLSKQGITIKYTKIKRNKAGEITTLKINLKDNKGAESNASWKSNQGIPKVEFGIANGSLVASSLD